MKTKQRLYHSIFHQTKAFCFVLMLLVSACGAQDEPNMGKGDKLELSDTAIKLNVDGWNPLVESRAWIYDNADSLQNEGKIGSLKPGGNFTLYAYFADMDDASLNGTAYLPGARVRYNTRYNEWSFRSGDQYIDHYWPQSGKLNFFAYMPYKDYTAKNTHVSDIAYEEGGGITFKCELPESNVNDKDQVEFIYAYAGGKHKEAVNFEFVHPFAIINFKLAAKSSRMTVNSLKLDGIHLQGTYSHKNNSTWSPTGDKASYFMTVGKRIPNEVNYNSVFAGPFLVMPQKFEDVKLTMNLTKQELNTTPYDIEAVLNGEWLPGHKYTYSIQHGDGDSEIYFSVQVEKWSINEYKNVVDVE